MHLLYATVAYLHESKNVRRSGTARTAVSPVKREGVSQVSFGCAKKNRDEPSPSHLAVTASQRGWPRGRRRDAESERSEETLKCVASPR